MTFPWSCVFLSLCRWNRKWKKLFWTGVHCATTEPESSPYPAPPFRPASAANWKAGFLWRHLSSSGTGNPATTTGARLVLALACRTPSSHTHTPGYFLDFSYSHLCPLSCFLLPLTVSWFYAKALGGKSNPKTKRCIIHSVCGIRHSSCHLCVEDLSKHELWLSMTLTILSASMCLTISTKVLWRGRQLCNGLSTRLFLSPWHCKVVNVQMRSINLMVAIIIWQLISTTVPKQGGRDKKKVLDATVCWLPYSFYTRMVQHFWLDSTICARWETHMSNNGF